MVSWHAPTAMLANQFGPALIILSLMTAIELLWPRERQSIGGRLAGVAFWLVYIPLTAVAATGFGALWQAIGVRPLLVVRPDLTWSGPAAIIAAPVLGAIIYDFFFYWFHRAQHRWFWRFHAVHHSIRELNAVNSYHHISEPVFQAIGIALPASLFACDTGTTVPLMAVLLHLHASYIHSPTRLHFGPLRALICDNRFHRLHHSLEERHFDRNFGAFTTLWDQLFGTACFPETGEWPATGIAGVDQPASIAAWVLLPRRIGEAPPTLHEPISQVAGNKLQPQR